MNFNLIIFNKIINFVKLNLKKKNDEIFKVVY